MQARRIACAALLALAFAVAGCGSGSGSDTEGGRGQLPVFPTVTPDASAAAARLACIDAWADVLVAHPRHWNPGDWKPAECAGQPGYSELDEYFEGSDKAETERARRAAASPIDDGASLTASGKGRP
ncbi:hypothetical protein [Streptomyces sp. NPDC005573]|uniref:hypothetical protein n=1 Tax=Streptomyces sp. NPDC005573 TaxID=3156890 RepID=UPI0033BE7334